MSELMETCMSKFPTLMLVPQKQENWIQSTLIISNSKRPEFLGDNKSLR